MHDYKPVSVEDMLIKSTKHTICDVLRKIYIEAEANGLENIMLNARIATAMGKAMSKALQEAKPDTNVNDFFPLKEEGEL